ncbi:hypothetical protein PAMC26510_07450 [Caballeronia sordidicola]|uniref:Uncharacterized protein n=2 Tax=Burkholderiales TaxID=80840 RepID=A0A242N5H8_CABSO|nr:hypothetical protein PAMC26510_07450 [Caballeronia sordidicola]
MTWADVVKTTIYLVSGADRAAFNVARSEVTGGIKNAATLLFVSGLALPGLLVEVEAVAAAAE